MNKYDHEEWAKLVRQIGLEPVETEGQARTVAKFAATEIARLRVQRDKVVTALKFVLPLAKGYENEHRVGSNGVYIIEAINAIAEAEKEP